TLPAASEVTLGIYDITGRLVRRMTHGRLPAGPHRLDWDGRTESGGTATAGVYLVRLEAAGGRVEGKVVKSE
ncbi:MAG: FlgD immunoglobulin-like domain containing protein, partial [Candidatus Eisenbacteria bacterium]|nr:FlgD immunoglobulin-like domain containing protein [Candidatus Eisenbacteria bacterium]